MTRPAICLLLLCVFLLPAQQEDAVFKSSANLVILDVSARDSSGKELPRLAQGRFCGPRRWQAADAFGFRIPAIERVGYARRPGRRQANTGSRPRAADRDYQGGKHPVSGPPAADHVLRFLRHGDSRATARAESGARIRRQTHGPVRSGLDHDVLFQADRRRGLSRTTRIA